ncbi:MAG: mechanosensitive ion channel [Myxococcota bacterium]
MNQLEQILTQYLGPLATSALAKALIGLVVLVVGLFVVRVLVGVASRVLKSVGFLNRKKPDGTEVDLASPLISLLRAVLTVFVLMAVLQYFGLTDVLEPLKGMVTEFVAAIPNVIGAGIIAYAGWVIAQIVSDLVGIGLGKVDQQIAQRTGNDEFKVSSFGRAFVFGSILLPVVVSALGVLNIPSISDPASQMIGKLMSAVPNIIGAGIILLVVYFVSKFVVFMLSGLLDGMGFDQLPSKLGIERLFNDTFTPTRLTGNAIMFFSMLGAATAAVNVLKIEIISNVFARVLEFGGGILVGALILIVGNYLGTVAYEKLSERGSKGLANIARVAILGLVIAMGLKSMGLADNIVNMAFGFTMGSVSVAVALAFGLGGRDAAKRVADHWATRVSGQ